MPIVLKLLFKNVSMKPALELFWKTLTVEYVIQMNNFKKYSVADYNLKNYGSPQVNLLKYFKLYKSAVEVSTTQCGFSFRYDFYLNSDIRNHVLDLPCSSQSAFHCCGYMEMFNK
uniref:Parkin RBR E3 ubiquitin protein ligase n=1 Tax=Pongo abelii TaxID=9601 RepID=A0A8I5U5M2_PONAB